MPDLIVTNAGANRLLTAGAQPTHLQFGSGTLPMADWAGRSMVPGVIKTLPLIQAIEATQLQTVAVDDDDTAAYTNFSALGLWIGDPVDAASVLMAFGTAATGETYGDKALEIDLQVNANVTLTAAQLGNVTFDLAVVLNMTETRFGMGRLATMAEALAGMDDTGLLTSLKNQQWWDDLAVPTNKLSGQVLNAQIASVAASKLTGELESSQYGNGTVINSKIVSMAASKLTGDDPFGKAAPGQHLAG